MRIRCLKCELEFSVSFALTRFCCIAIHLRNRGVLATRHGCLTATLLTLLIAAGCQSTNDFSFDPQLDHYQDFATQIEYPDVETRAEDNPSVLESAAPLTLRNVAELPSWTLTLEEAVRTALMRSTVMRDAGGRVVTQPQASQTVFDPAISEADPNRGVEAALAAFDANFSTSLLIGKDDQSFNNLFFGGGAASLQSNTGTFLAEVTKTAATGTRFSLRKQTDYNRNTSPANLFPSAYNTVIEGEFRHPLLQGSGISFNRIAGPNSIPGQYNGVLLARLNNDIALTDFERAVRDLVLNVERAYWNLYFAYRDLEAKLARRDAALETWRKVQLRTEGGLEAGDREALARQQYYEARVEVENSLTGVAGVGGGVHLSERTLRRLMGLPTNDGRLIRPADKPLRTDVVFDWDECLTQALWRRSELRRQKWTVKQRELQLTAAENFLQMRLDMVGQYRWRGFGDELLGNAGVPNSSAFQDLFGGDLQGWQFGLQLSTPIGNRQAHAAFRHAELQLAREHALLHEQELQVAHDLADSFSELDRAFSVAKSNFNRAIAAQEQAELVDLTYKAGKITLENVLDAQSRSANATSAFYRSLVQYTLAVANLHYTRGSLLDYHQIHLNEGPWTEWAHTSALKQARRFRSNANCYQEPCGDLSRGPLAQDREDVRAIGVLPSELNSPVPSPAPSPTTTPPPVNSGDGRPETGPDVVPNQDPQIRPAAYFSPGETQSPRQRAAGEPAAPRRPRLRPFPPNLSRTQPRRPLLSSD